MMLEADVVLGTLEGGSGDQIPVMAHPPANVSDLSLEGFLAEVVAATQKGQRCGIKLDFKTVEVLRPSLRQLQQLEHQVRSAHTFYRLEIMRGICRPLTSRSVESVRRRAVKRKPCVEFAEIM